MAAKHEKGISAWMRRRLDKELESDEHIIWSARPMTRYRIPEIRGSVTFSVLKPLIILYVLWFAVFKIFPELSEVLTADLPFMAELRMILEGLNETPTIHAIVELFKQLEQYHFVGFVFILIAIDLLLGFLKPLWNSFFTAYAITGQRAIVFEGGYKTSIWTYTPVRLQDTYRKERPNQTGDLIITVRRYTDFDGELGLEELGFFNLRSPKTAEKILAELANSIRKAV